MKQYRVVVTDKAESALDRYIGYLADVKKNEQAANNLFYDYIETRKELERVAGSIKAPESQKLKDRNLKRINFRRHNYFMLFRIDGDKAVVVEIFHGLEDYEKKLE